MIHAWVLVDSYTWECTRCGYKEERHAMRSEGYQEPECRGKK